MARRRARCDPLLVALRTLIVDDSPRFLQAARGLLEGEGIAVVAVAATSDEALRRADELQPDVTLVDICLGDEDGVDLAQRLSIAQQAPVILISTYAHDEVAHLVSASDAIGFVSKSELSASAIQDVLGC
jgi:DNA-binding NarL/FixJ family response regulator